MRHLRYLRRTRELRSSRLWTTGLVLLPLTAVISVQFVSVSNAAIVGGRPRSAESFGAMAVQLSKVEKALAPLALNSGWITGKFGNLSSSFLSFYRLLRTFISKIVNSDGCGVRRTC
jgi:hypothetical protein